MRIESTIPKCSSESICRCFGSLSVTIPLLDPWELPFDYSRPENNRYHSLSNKHRDPRIIIPGVSVSSESNSSEINRNHHPKGQMNPTKNCIPISCQIHSSFELSWCSFNFASYSSLERPCHPIHIPVGDLPHPHLLICFISPDSSHYASVLREGGSGFDTAVSRPILMS